MTQKKIDKLIEQYPDEEFLQIDGFDDAIMGVTEDMVLVYDVNKILNILALEMDMVDAKEHFLFNISGAFMGEKTPIFVETID